MTTGGEDFDLGKVVGDTGEKGDDGSSVWNTSTAPTYANSKYTFTISNLNGKTGLDVAVNDIIFYSTYYYIVSAVNSTTVDCSTRVSIKGSDASVTIVTSFSSTTSDAKVPSEKLTKTELDKKISTSSTNGLIKNDGTVDTTTYSTFSGSYSDLSNKPSIPSDVSELTDTQNTAFTPKSHTHGNINNDGTITTTDTGYFTYFVGVGSSNSRLYKAQYLRANQVTDGNANQYSSLGSLTSGDNQQTINGAIDTALGNKVNTSDIADNLTTNDGAKVLSAKQGYLLNTLKLNISQSSAKGKNVVVNSTTGFIDFEDKPTIPSSSSDLSDGSDLVKKSSTTGLIKNDGSIDTSAYITSSALSNYVQKSSTSGLLKNDGSVDTNTYLTSSAISGMLTSSDVANNLTTTTSGKVLDARQGKALADLIGDAITYINQ